MILSKDTTVTARRLLTKPGTTNGRLRTRIVSQFLHQVRSRGNLSSSAATAKKTSTSPSLGDPHRRTCTALYRQLLRWCDEIDPTMPLGKLVPPVRIEPPRVHPESLRLVAQRDPRSPLARSNTSLNDYFPSNALIRETGMTVPIPNSIEAKLFVQAVFRMNSYPPNRITNSSSIDDTDTMRKKQLSIAFEGVRNLNELVTKQLKLVQETRDKHLDRTGVNFRVGQVVQHNTHNWRGVIFGWNRVDDQGHVQNETPMPPTSLTQKSYHSNNSDDKISYIVFLDRGDASIMIQSNQHVSDIMNVYQSELSLVKDPDLLRIRSEKIGEHFERFDPATQCFVQGEVSSYVYPMDTLDAKWSEYQNPSDPSAESIIDGIQKMSEYSRNIILGYTSAPEARKLSILSTLLERYTKIAQGDVLPNEERFAVGDHSTQSTMKYHLLQFMSLFVELSDTLWTRRTSIETDRHIKYSLGQVVRHKKYGFRGVVVAWDSEPAYEVTHWDGLQHIEKPEQYPFYHVIPDPNDSMAAFGWERAWRYVCEENLESCPVDSRDIEVDLEPEWSRETSTGLYIPPDDLVFRHGGQLEDEGVTENCLKELKDATIELLVSVRECTTTTVNNDLIGTVSQKMATSKLFDVLKNAEDSETATVITDTFKELWKAHKDGDIRFKFDTGTNYLRKGKTEQALSVFGEVVDTDPAYAEAFNRASTAEYMIGNLDASLVAAHKTLELVPDHFQAMNGLGLVYNEKKDLELAAEVFRKSIDLDPWSPVAGRLAVCMDTLERRRKTTFNTKKKADSTNDRTG